MYPESDKSGYQIFIDEPELEDTVLDFPNYINTLSNIILNSRPPKYTVGIFGEWGTGKSTLMGNIMKVLKSHNCKCLEFNAWRYEGENRLATFPMMLNILGQFIEDRKIRNDLEKIDNEENKGLRKSIKRVLQGLSFSGSVGLPMAAEAGFSYDPSQAGQKEDTSEDILEFYKKNIPALQEGYELIKKLIDLADGTRDNDELKLVVFVDDLDRCTPEKASEVLESIKVFFDIKGIVFVLGLSKSVVEAAIDVKYKDYEETFNGSDYLKKIIQVPFLLPKWSNDDLEKYVKNIVEKTKNQKYLGFFQETETQKIIAGVINSNPREAKRLLNNFILARNIFNNEALVDNKKLLLSQALVLRWKTFYDDIFLNEKLLEFVSRGVIEIQDRPDAVSFEEARSKTISNMERDMEPGLKVKTSNKEDGLFHMEKYAIKMLRDDDLVNFLGGVGRILLEMSSTDWEFYRRTNQVDADILYLNESDKKQDEKYYESEEYDMKMKRDDQKINFARKEVPELMVKVEGAIRPYYRLIRANYFTKRRPGYKEEVVETKKYVDELFSELFLKLENYTKLDPKNGYEYCYRFAEHARRIGFVKWESKFRSLVSDKY